ncbi:hypothetical protein FIBSPDRAFT_958993 [Athelia psychrophila]|uniref:CSC1/OSCA1-like 7TM region domain-containing protein n=1 Tax=Athelia psychrophila TaxID=1759441 RepID=A0A166E2Z2_9AGAM|nr:hypothetical protein FIBSPDRAFT_958993 [Fibularhizoctonia sp. CBS 109695]
MAVTLILHYIKLTLLGFTPRSIYGLEYGARYVVLGTLFPGTNLLVVIGLGYSIIAPYLFLWVLEQPASSETGGLCFPKAINHVLVGLCVRQVLLAAPFFLAAKGKPTPIPEGTLMIVLIIVMAIFQSMINNSYGPLLHSLPLSLVDRIEARARWRFRTSSKKHAVIGVRSGSGSVSSSGGNNNTARAERESAVDGREDCGGEGALLANATNTGYAQPYSFQGNDREEHQQQAHAYPPSSSQYSNKDEDEQDMKRSEEHD